MTNFIPFRKGKKWGFSQWDSQIIIECIHDYAEQYHDKFAKVRTRTEFGFIDKIGNYIFHHNRSESIFFSGREYDFIDKAYFNEGLIPAIRNESLNIMDEDGNIVFEVNYDMVGFFSEGLAAVSVDGNVGFINRKGDLVIPCRFEIKYGGIIDVRFSEGLTAVCSNSKYGYINKDGKVVIDFQFDSASNFINGIALVSQGLYYGLINKSNELVVPISWRFGRRISEYYIFNHEIGDGSTFYVIDFKGTFVQEFHCNWVHYLGKDMFLLDKYSESQKKVVSINGDLIFFHNFFSINPFTDNYTSVGLGGSSPYFSGVINSSGKLLFSNHRVNINSFNQGISLVEELNPIYHDAYFPIGYVNYEGKEYWTD